MRAIRRDAGLWPCAPDKSSGGWLGAGKWPSAPVHVRQSIELAETREWVPGRRAWPRLRAKQELISLNCRGSFGVGSQFQKGCKFGGVLGVAGSRNHLFVGIQNCII